MDGIELIEKDDSGLWIPKEVVELFKKEEINYEEMIFLSHVYQITYDSPYSLTKHHVASMLRISYAKARQVINNLHEKGLIDWFGNVVILGENCPDFGIHPLQAKKIIKSCKQKLRELEYLD